MTEPPSIVGRYHLVRLIAHGGMGSLYLARDPAIDRLVAIKLLKEGFDDSARERFTREARAAGRLHHPNIVTVFDVGEHEHRPFIAMEYVQGETLAQLINRRAVGRLSEKLAILEVLCAALQHAHNATIIHRDIKPANVMVNADGVVKVLDFGIARAGGLLATQVGDVVGTLNYMSPEQLAGNEVDHRTDIYSVGALAYELVTSRMSFPGTITTGVLNKILYSAPPAIESLVPGIDPDITAIIEHAMEKDPDARYQDLEAMREDLAAVRTRLIETGSDMDDAANADAETRFYGAIGSGSGPRSSPRSTWMLPSSGRNHAARSAIQARAKRRARQMVTLGVGLAALAVILTSVWFMNRPPVSTPSQTETAPQVQPPPTTTTPPSALDPPEPNRTNRAPVEEELIAIRSTARRQIAGGERQAALETLTRGLALDPKDPQINAVLDDLVAGARRAAVEARTAATRRGERSSGVFQDAQAREREADTFTRAGDRVSAVQAFWSAASRYNQVPESPGQKAAAPSRAEAPRADAPAPQPAPTEPPPPEPRNTQSPSTLPLKPSPAAPLPAPQTPELPRTQRDPAPDPVAAQIEAVRDTLRRYTQAYQSLNSAAVGAVMPGLTSEQLRNLDRDFSNYRSYTVDIRDARIAVAGETATVACQVVRSFETKNGVAGNHTVPTVFHLRRVGARWMIERLESR